jgi:N-acetylneuraminic acid mutarotase
MAPEVSSLRGAAFFSNPLVCIQRYLFPNLSLKRQSRPERGALPTRALRLSGCVVLSTILLPTIGAQPRDLSFEERVKAQEAIDRIYYSHQIGATRPFEAAVPRRVLERKVRTYLKQTVALEEFWKTTITSAALERELDRIAAGTRFPERLETIYGALGRDPNLILECLARPVLVDRLSRNFFATDERIHAAAREEADGLRRLLLAGSLDTAAEHPFRQVVELEEVESPMDRREPPSVASGAPLDSERAVRRLELEPDEFRRWRGRAPRRVGEIGPVVEEREAFVLTVALAERTGWFRLGVYSIPKVAWDEWWRAIEEEMDESRVRAVAPLRGGLPVPMVAPAPKLSSKRQMLGISLTGNGPDSPGCVPDDTWDNGVLDDMPKPRYDHTAVWTGNLMIVWGGAVELGETNTGARYDPLTDTWAPASTVNAPMNRELQTAVWTGTIMIVWGESDVGGSPSPAGGRYDPVSDSWEPTSTVGAPEGRYAHTAVWTGSEMIVWGGTQGGPMLNSGGRYNPATDTWSATSTAGAPSPRAGQTAIWTGSRMIIWGGVDSVGNALSTGGRYDPVSNTWSPTSGTGAPSARFQHSAVWTGSEMIVWGGGPSYSENTGGRYDPVSNTWAATSLTGAPSPRDSHTAVWTGKEMIVWGGKYSLIDFEEALQTGGRYDPAADSWLPTPTSNAPSRRAKHSAVWTGSQMIVWGGHTDVNMGLLDAILNSGGRYEPASDSWTPTSLLNTPSGVLCCHSAVWTGNLMIVWGGLAESHIPVRSGARYDPLTDAWTPTTRTNAPAPRESHQAVWTGNEMIVWGGVRNDGGRYNPVSDSWRPMSTSGAPSPRFLTTPAVWTGREMIVWGGLLTTTTATDTGGRYDPATDTWSATSTTDTPSPRHFHTAVWTGNEMIVWGGSTPFVGLHNTGGRYDPLADAWRPVSLPGAPSARQLHSAIWTGSLMILWGGTATDPIYLNTGGRYDPATDSWTATSTTNTPVGRYSHTAIWTGNKMIIWGGSTNTGAGNTGGLYDSATDSWTPTSTAEAPSYGAQGHTAVWTGGFMIIWARNWGGRYALEQSVDNDADGFSDCAGDCDDTNPLVWSLPVEVSNLEVSAASPTGLNWASQASMAGPGTRYDLSSGPLLPSGGPDLGSGICLQSSAATTHSDGRPDPEVGSGFWYLVRGRNTCAVGTYGTPLRDAGIPPCP